MDIPEIDASIDTAIETINPYLLLLGYGAIGLVSSIIVIILLHLIFAKFMKENAHIARGLRAPFAAIVTIVTLKVAADQIGILQEEYWGQLFRIAFIILATWLIITFVTMARKVLLLQYNLDTSENLRARKAYTQIRVFERIIIVIVLIISVALILMTFETIRSIGTSMLASAGIAGIIIGVAAQKLLANLLAGFQIAVTQPIRLDDVVIMEGEWGWIEEITLTYIVVRIWDKRRLVIPSSQVIEKPFQNWTRHSSDLLGTVFLYADYRMPVQPFRDELDRLMKDQEMWDGVVANVQVTNLSHQSMEVRFLVSARNSPVLWDLRVWLREKMIDFMQENYPQYLPKSRVVLQKDGTEEGTEESRNPQPDASGTDGIASPQ